MNQCVKTYQILGQKGGDEFWDTIAVAEEEVEADADRKKGAVAWEYLSTGGGRNLHGYHSMISGLIQKSDCIPGSMACRKDRLFAGTARGKLSDICLKPSAHGFQRDAKLSKRAREVSKWQDKNGEIRAGDIIIVVSQSVGLTSMPSKEGFGLGMDILFAKDAMIFFAQNSYQEEDSRRKSGIPCHSSPRVGLPDCSANSWEKSGGIT